MIIKMDDKCMNAQGTNNHGIMTKSTEEEKKITVSSFIINYFFFILNRSVGYEEPPITNCDSCYLSKLYNPFRVWFLS